MNPIISAIRCRQDTIINHANNLQKHYSQQQKLLTKDSALNILHIISSFDPSQIEKISNQFQDQLIRKYSLDIIAKINQLSENRPDQNQKEVKKQLIIEKVEVKIESNKNQGRSRLKQGNAQSNRGNSKSLLKSVIGYFGKKEETAKEMIFPKHEPKVIFDPKTRKYLIEGEEPEPEKEVPKPPLNNPKKNSLKPESIAKKSEFDEMTAPPAFKRKGTATKSSKSHSKMEEIEEVKAIGCQFSHENFIEQMNQQFSQLIHQMVELMSDFEKSKPNNMSPGNEQIIQLIETTLSISKHQDLLIKDLENLKTNHQEDEILQVFDHCISELQQFSNSPHFSLINFEQENIAQVRSENVSSELANSQMMAFESKIEQLSIENNLLIKQIQQAKHESLQQQQHHQNLLNNIAQIQENCSSLQNQNQNLKGQYQQLLNSYQQNELKHIQNQKEETEQMQFEQKLREQKENICLSTISSFKSHENILYEFEDVLHNENELLNRILERRIQLNLPVEEYQNTTKYEESLNEFEKVCHLDFSQIISSLTESYMERMETSNRNYRILQQRYQGAKEAILKLKSNSKNQILTLNRSLSRLKNLVDTYKHSQEQSEHTASQLEFQCEKLKKKLLHYKQEDQFNKDAFEKLKKSTIINQNDSLMSLQEDNEELLERMEEFEQEIIEKQKIIQDLRRDIEDLIIQQEQNQKYSLESTKRNQQLQQCIQQLKFQIDQKQYASILVLNSEKKELQLKIATLLEKIQSQKQRLEEISSKGIEKHKYLEIHHEAKISTLKRELEKMKNQQIILLEQNSYMQKQMKRYQVLYNRKQTEVGSVREALEEELKNKQKQCMQLLYICEENEQHIRVLTAKCQVLREEELLSNKFKNQLKMLNEGAQAQKIHFAEEEGKMQQVLKGLISNFEEYKNSEWEDNKKVAEKVAFLSNELQISNEQSEELLSQIQQYHSLIEIISTKMNTLEEQCIIEKNQYLTTLHQEKYKSSSFQQHLLATQNENQELKSLIDSLGQDLQQLAYQLNSSEDNKNNLMQSLAQKETEIHQLKLNFVQYEKNYCDNSKLQTISRENQQFKIIIQNNDIEIQNLNQQLQQVEQALENSNKYLEKIKSIQQINKELQRKQQLFESIEKQFQNQIEQQTKTIINLNEKLAKSLHDKSSEESVKIRENSENESKEEDQEMQMQELLYVLEEKQGQITSLNNQILMLKDFINKKESEINKIVQKYEQRLKQLEKNFIKETEKFNHALSMEKNQFNAEKERIINEKLLIQDLKESQIKSLNEQIINLTSLVDKQEKQIQAKSNSMRSERNQNFNEAMQSKDNEIQEIKKNLNQIDALFRQKQKQAENKIESLEKELLGTISLKNTFKKLQENYKTLELQNSSLLSEKVELMKSNDYLIEVNQKLIAQKSPHHVIKEIKNFPSKDPKAPQKSDEILVINPSQRNEAKGFFGTLSSIFLTPTEAEKTVKSAQPK